MKNNKPLLIGVVAVVAISVVWIGYQIVRPSNRVVQSTTGQKFAQQLQERLFALEDADRFAYVITDFAEGEGEGEGGFQVSGMVRNQADLAEVRRVADELGAELDVGSVTFNVRVGPLPGD